jgi:DNA mismatch endonuclease, patch repair protein
MADIYDKAKRSEIMSCVKHTRTAPEEEVAGLLKKLKIKYLRNVKTLPGQPDFLIKSAKTVIFVHGCFWHAHSNCKLARRPSTNKAFWVRKEIDNKRRDQRKNRLLRKQGWHILTIWQCSLRQPEKVSRRLEKAAMRSAEDEKLKRTPNSRLL